MKQSLIVIISAIIFLYGCRVNNDKPVNPASGKSTVEKNDLIQILDDGRKVSVKSYFLEKGEAEDHFIKQGVTDILNKMTDLYITQIKLNSTSPLKGTCIYIFRIEPNGMFRMIQEGPRSVVEEDFAPLKEAFLVGAMAHDFKFPATGSPLVVKIEFEFN